MKTSTVNTCWCRIYMAGDIDTAKVFLRRECTRNPICVTIEPCDYIYAGGMESGFMVGFLNYPRFPKTGTEIYERAVSIAEGLRVSCAQGSYTIMTPDNTTWFSYRKEDQ